MFYTIKVFSSAGALLQRFNHQEMEHVQWIVKHMHELEDAGHVGGGWYVQLACE